MKTKTKMIIAISLAGVITLGLLIALVVVIASFNATTENGLKILYTAKNVEAEVSMGYVVSATNSFNPKSLAYTTVKAGSDEKLTFSSSDTTDAVTKSFDDIPAIDLGKNQYIYLKYTFTHTGTETNSNNYLNVTLNHAFTTNNNIKIQYMLYDPAMTVSYVNWMAGINGLTICRDADNEAVVFARICVDVKTQDSLLVGDFAWSMTGSDTEYYTNLSEGNLNGASGDYAYRKIEFDYATEENLAKVANAVSKTSVESDGSAPITAYEVYDEASTYYDLYVLSDKEIFVNSCYEIFKDSLNMGCTSSIVLTNFNTKYVAHFSWMFTFCSGLKSIDLSAFDTSNAEQLSHMFRGCTGLTEIDLSPLNTSKVFGFAYMFYNCTGLTKLDVSTLDTSKATTLNYMFGLCRGLTTLDISTFDTKNVTSMRSTFANCTGLTSLELGELNTRNVTSMSQMFYECSGLTTLDLSSFNTANVTELDLMFADSASLVTIYVSANWKVSEDLSTYSSDMFSDCTSLVGGNGTACDGTNNTDATYARIDTAETPGYFTLKTS